MLQIDASLFVTFFVVWGLVFVLSKIFWKPMIKTTAERDTRLAEDREASRRGLADYDKALKDVASSMKAARTAADKAREDLEAEALREKTRLLAEVAASSKDRIEKAKAQVRDEITQLKSELSAKAEGLAVEIEKRLLG